MPRPAASPVDLAASLAPLSLAATLADLPTHNFRIDSATLSHSVVERFKQEPDLPGALIVSGDRLIGLLSRTKCFEYLSRPYSLEIYLARPVAVLLETIAAVEARLAGSERVALPPYFALPDQTPILDAAARALQRPESRAYEPIAVQVADSQYYLLDMRVLLLAQSHLLSLANQTIQARDRRLAQQNSALVELTRSSSLAQENLAAALCEVTEIAVDALEAERVSLWVFRQQRRRLDCLDCFERQSNQHRDGYQLLVEQVPRYFRALAKDRLLLADDALNDRRLRDLTGDRAPWPLLSKLLAAPIRFDGRTIGLLQVERVAGREGWTQEDCNFANSLTDTVSLALEARQRQRAQQALRRAEAEYRSIFEYAVEGIFRTTPEGMFLSANPALAKLYGYPAPDQMIAQCKRISQIYVEPQRRAEFQRLMAEQGRVDGFES